MIWRVALEEVADSLDHPVDVFFRVDDGGWDTPALLQLSSVAARFGVPLDIAMIPDDTDARLADTMLDMRELGQPLGVHQHGCAHLNHEPSGRKCEFGTSRPVEQRREDLLRGKEKLRTLFGSALDPIFTPPWNRCADETYPMLAEAGFRAISADRIHPAAARAALTELPVLCDWQRKKQGVRLAREEIAAGLANTVRTVRAPIGIMLHHAALTPEDLAETGLLFETVNRHPMLKAWPMRHFLGDHNV